MLGIALLALASASPASTPPVQMPAVIAAQSSPTFAIPNPVPDLVGLSSSQVLAILGSPSETRSDGTVMYEAPRDPDPDVVRAKAELTYRKGTVGVATWTFPGNLTRPSDFPELAWFFPSGADLTKALATKSETRPFEKDGVKDFFQRRISWSCGGACTATVLCPYLTDASGHATRAAAPGEYRVLELTVDGAGPIDLEVLGIHPVPLFTPAPPYPRALREQKLYGAVTLELVVGPRGTVVNVRVLDGDPLFAKPAAKTASTWRWQPLLVNGRAIVWKTTVHMSFEP